PPDARPGAWPIRHPKRRQTPGPATGREPGPTPQQLTQDLLQTSPAARPPRLAQTSANPARPPPPVADSPRWRRSAGLARPPGEAPRHGSATSTQPQQEDHPPTHHWRAHRPVPNGPARPAGAAAHAAGGHRQCEPPAAAPPPAKAPARKTQPQKVRLM